MRTRVNAATLTQAISLSTPQTVPDGQGGYIETPLPLTPPNDWASIEPALSSSDELPIAGTTQGSLTHRVVLRYRGDINLQTQITFPDLGGTIHRLYVRSMQNPRQQYEVLELWCEEKTI